MGTLSLLDPLLDVDEDAAEEVVVLEELVKVVDDGRTETTLVVLVRELEPATETGNGEVDIVGFVVG